ncbi:unnamed protein product [Musa textilis]
MVVAKDIIRVKVVTLLLCMVVAAKCEWVDYPSGIRCCSVIAVEACEPENPVMNRACMDVCHYGSCRKGGQCEYLGFSFAKACRCNC